MLRPYVLKNRLQSTILAYQCALGRLKPSYAIKGYGPQQQLSNRRSLLQQLALTGYRIPVLRRSFVIDPGTLATVI